MRTKEETRDYWNKRAGTFSGRREGNTYQTAVLAAAQQNGVDFANKRVLDLGCGAGSYALRIAREAAHVTALDISARMLERLAESAAAKNITNITCIESDWLDYETDEYFDIIFCSLTPAISVMEAAEKLIEFPAGQVVYITLLSPIKAYLLEKLFITHSALWSPSFHKSLVRKCLEERGTPFKAVKIGGEWASFWSREAMIDNCIHILDAHSIKPDKKIIEEFIMQYETENGEYRSVTGYDAEMIIWNL